MKIKIALNTFLFVSLFALSCFAQPGSIDPSFNPTDIGFGNGDGADYDVYSISIQSDGKIIIGGGFIYINGTGRNCIARLNSDGTLDTTFNPGSGASSPGPVSPSVNSISIQSDGKIVIGGEFTSFNGIGKNHIARLNSDGSLDTTFNQGSGANNIVLSTSIQIDGKIVIGGGFTTFNGIGRNRIARLNTDGTLDTTFNPGLGSNDWVESSSIQPDGKIVIGGGFSQFNGIDRYSIARLNNDGSLDTTFNPGTGASHIVKTTSIQSDWKIVIGGLFTSFNGTPRKRIARLNTDGTLDTTFNPGSGADDWVNSISIQPDGKIVIGGEFTSFNGNGRNHIARLNSDGTLDTTFNPGSMAINEVFSTSIPNDGKIVIGGTFISLNGTDINYIARLNSDGSLDTTFNQGSGANSQVYSTSIQNDGKIVIGGGFTTFNGTGRNCIARLNTDGTLDTTFNPGSGASSMVYSTSIQSDGKIVIGGIFTSFNGFIRNRLARLNSDGSLDTIFNPGSGANGSVYHTSIQPDRKIVIGGEFTTFNGTNRNRMARLNIDGSLDTTFNQRWGPNNSVLSTSIQIDGKIVIGGRFTSVNGPLRSRIARLNSDGNLDTTFNPG